MNFQKIIEKIDELIERIPGHIRDLIQKGAFALIAMLALLTIVLGIQWGMGDAEPGGMQLAKDNRDLFYLQQIREENQRKRQLVEDVEIDPLEFPSNQQRQYREMVPEKKNLLEEDNQMLRQQESMRQPANNLPSYMTDDVIVRPKDDSNTNALLPDTRDQEMLKPNKPKEEKKENKKEQGGGLQTETQKKVQPRPQNFKKPSKNLEFLQD